MLTENNSIITTIYLVGQSLVFIQHDDFISIMDLLVLLLNKRSLIWSVTFHALWFLEHCVPLSLILINQITMIVVYNPKQEKSSKGHEPPGTNLIPGVFRRNDYKYYDFGVLVEHLADSGH